MITTREHDDLDGLATRIARVLISSTGRDQLDALEQHLSIELYRLLAEGKPVARGALAARLGVTQDAVDHILDAWPAVYSDTERRVVGFWGLALPAAYSGPHCVTIKGQPLSAWCAWDTLFLPQLLGQSAEVESTAPDGGGTVHLTVTPERIERVEPADVHMSFLLPDAADVQRDVVTSFCHFVHFFPSRDAGEHWIASHADTFLLSIHDAHAVAVRRNQAMYPALLP